MDGAGERTPAAFRRGITNNQTLVRVSALPDCLLIGYPLISLPTPDPAPGHGHWLAVRLNMTATSRLTCVPETTKWIPSTYLAGDASYTEMGT